MRHIVCKRLANANHYVSSQQSKSGTTNTLTGIQRKLFFLILDLRQTNNTTVTYVLIIISIDESEFYHVTEKIFHR